MRPHRHRRRAHRTVLPRLLLTALSLLPLSACAGLSGGPIEGRVLEAGTNKPIAEAIVVARWEGHLASYAHGKTVCYHVLTTTTNGEGQYRFPAWNKDITEDWQKNIRPERVLIDAYKPGYRFHSAPEDRANDRVLAPFTGGRGERLEYLSSFTGMQCGSRDNYSKQLAPLYRSIYEEARGLAVTKEERRSVSNRLRDLEEMEFGYDKAWENWRVRERELR